MLIQNPEVLMSSVLVLEFIRIQGLTLGGAEDCCLSSNMWEKQTKKHTTHPEKIRKVYVCIIREDKEGGKKKNDQFPFLN